MRTDNYRKIPYLNGEMYGISHLWVGMVYPDHKQNKTAIPLYNNALGIITLNAHDSLPSCYRLT